jgi:hypothetical protein
MKESVDVAVLYWFSATMVSKCGKFDGAGIEGDAQFSDT